MICHYSIHDPRAIPRKDTAAEAKVQVIGNCPLVSRTDAGSGHYGVENYREEFLFVALGRAQHHHTIFYGSAV
jgi:hypothetical protein